MFISCLESLTLAELQKLYKTPCDIDVLKRASIFACLTGMRRSDIMNLTWGNIKSYSDGGKYVEFYAQKTKARNIIPISEEAYKLISQNRKSINGKVFEGFEIIMAQKPLKAWLRKAGIKKRITFHMAKHKDFYKHQIINRFNCLPMKVGNDKETSELLYSTLFCHFKEPLCLLQR